VRAKFERRCACGKSRWNGMIGHVAVDGLIHIEKKYRHPYPKHCLTRLESAIKQLQRRAALPHKETRRADG
jgi:hypothetical protein